ncbi:MAG TPA: hypothetical protein VFQ67_16340 [Allosphingosinicella sp.]|jgi:hypothetical protein|nr:hypothetical protein [Allosphingosinicella sp.]
MLITRWRTRPANPPVKPLDDRDLASLLAEVRTFSRSLPFVDTSGDEDGSWEPMFDELMNPPDGAMSPHLALLVAFGTVFRHSQDAFNLIPERLAAIHRECVLRGAEPVAGRLGAGGTARDLERLVLDRFKGVDRVRVLPARDASGRPRPGHLLVLAASKRAAAKGRPLPDRLKERICAALASATSPLARIHLSEPAVSPVDIHVVAAFRGQRGPRRLESDLRRLLSPAGAHRLDLPDDCSPAALRDRITRFILARPCVLDIGKLDVEAKSGAGVSVPVAGRIAIHSMRAEESR